MRYILLWQFPNRRHPYYPTSVFSYEEEPFVLVPIEAEEVHQVRGLAVVDGLDPVPVLGEPLLGERHHGDQDHDRSGDGRPTEKRICEKKFQIDCVNLAI